MYLAPVFRHHGVIGPRKSIPIMTNGSNLIIGCKVVLFLRCPSRWHVGQVRQKISMSRVLLGQKKFPTIRSKVMASAKWPHPSCMSFKTAGTSDGNMQRVHEPFLSRFSNPRVVSWKLCAFLRVFLIWLVPNPFRFNGRTPCCR